MPRPGPVRPSVTLRLDADTIAFLDAIAKRDGTTRSELIRRLIERQTSRTIRRSDLDPRQDREPPSTPAG